MEQHVQLKVLCVKVQCCHVSAHHAHGSAAVRLALLFVLYTTQHWAIYTVSFIFSLLII
jgi:hypothetical protein